jgi:hypothetical protein
VAIGLLHNNYQKQKEGHYIEQQGGIKQPMLGVLATIIIFLISLGIIS